VLDIGTGPGLLALEIARRGPDLDVVGLDIAPLMLDKARANARGAGLEDRVAFELGEAARLPFSDSSFDLVLSTLSLHHWSDLKAALTELYRVLRPGGRLWLYDMRGVSYSARELSSVFAHTPFGGTQLQESHLRAGRLPFALYKRFANRRNQGRVHV
jgi:ubiquinone/menaquinone biosynthesis C-methylase UbiE